MDDKLYGNWQQTQPGRYVFILLVLTISIFSINARAQSRTEITLKKGWKFFLGKNEKAYEKDLDDAGWQNVTVPHDWAINGPFDKEIDKQTVAITQNGEKVAREKTGRTGALPYIGEGWYRNRFRIPNANAKKTVLLQFDGAMSEPQVYLNGELVGKWNYGYNCFFIDISDRIRPGQENILAVHISNRPRSSRWYPGAGLFRNVHLVVKEQSSIEQWGVTVTTPVANLKLGKVNIKTRFAGSGMRLITEILDRTGKKVASDTTNKAYGNEFEQAFPITNPNLWSPETPYLYTAVSKLYLAGRLTDEVRTQFGIRNIQYSAAAGFQLNGVSRKFKGVCLHHDLGPLGTAVNTAALRRQLMILKDLGCNAIRSSHNMPSPEQVELCDELGFMFLAESFDEWAKPKVANGYHLFFDGDAEKDVVNLVRAFRNHPSIVMWSAGNEVPDQFGAEGVKRAKWLQDIFHREDPTRPVTVGMDQVKATMQSGFGALLDVPGLNYRVHLYEEAYKAFPQGFILGSETASTVSSRGVYKFPVEKAKDKRYDDFQCSSYDLEYCSWSNIPDEDFVLQDDKPWVIGEFVWTGFDYLGEPTPYDEQWPSRSSYFGLCDLAGIPKDRYYLYRSRWNTESATIHMLPHWNWKGREGEVTPVFVYTSYDRGELFINGKSMGIRKKNRSSPQERYRLMWMDVKYEPGTVKFVAMDSLGRRVAEKCMVTAGKPYQIRLEPDRKVIHANGQDISYITAYLVDRKGNVCPTASNTLNFQVEGKGAFQAVCNGDATSLEPFQKPEMKLFSGKLVFLVRSVEEPGNINIKVSSKGFASATVQLRSYRSTR